MPRMLRVYFLQSCARLPNLWQDTIISGTYFEVDRFLRHYLYIVPWLFMVASGLTLEANCSGCSTQLSCQWCSQCTGALLPTLKAQAPDPDFSGYVQVLFADPRH